jgi:hypothetical protein
MFMGEGQGGSGMRDYLGNAEFLVPQFLLFSHLIHVHCDTPSFAFQVIQTSYILVSI